MLGSECCLGGEKGPGKEDTMKDLRGAVRMGTAGRQRVAMEPVEERQTACRGRQELTSCIEAHFCLHRGVSIDR
jgi:hypothetical protein